MKVLGMIILIILIIFILGCDNENQIEGPPNYQTAIFTCNIDGSDVTKVLDLNSSENVQFAGDSQTILYLSIYSIFDSNYSLFKINTRNKNRFMISGDLELIKHLPSCDSPGNLVAVNYLFGEYQNVSVIDINTSDIIYESDRPRDEKFPQFSSDDNFLTYSVRDSIGLPYSIVKFNLLSFEEEVIYTNFNNNLILETYLDIENELIYFCEANYRGNGKLVKYDLMNDVRITITDNLSLDVSNQTCFTQNLITYPNFPDVGLFDLDTNTEYLIEDVFWPNLSVSDDSKLLTVSSEGYIEAGSNIYVYDITTFSEILYLPMAFRGIISNDGMKLVYIGYYDLDNLND